jgi:cytochrome c-type biogenesis protein
MEKGLGMNGEVTFPLAFIAGLATFLSPCVLPLVPVYLASISGQDIVLGDTRTNRWPVFLHSLLFVLGLTLVFVLLGVGAGLAGAALRFHLVLIRQVSGGVLVALGVLMLTALKVPWLNYEKRLSVPAGKTTGYLRSFITGGVFCLAWTPCAGPVLGGILTLALSAEAVAASAFLLFIYALGVGLPFLVAGLAVNAVLPALNWLRRRATFITIVSGVLLMVLGILVIFDQLNLITGVFGGTG